MARMLNNKNLNYKEMWETKNAFLVSKQGSLREGGGKRKEKKRKKKKRNEGSKSKV